MSDSTSPWQPIDTAPTDQWVLTFNVGDYGQLVVARRVPRDEQVLDELGWFDAEESEIGSPSHWMPIPEPPRSA